MCVSQLIYLINYWWAFGVFFSLSHLCSVECVLWINCWICRVSVLERVQLLCILTSTWFVFVFNLVVLVGVCILWSACLSFAHFSTELYVFSYCLWSPFYILDTSPFVGYLYCEFLSILWFALSLFTCLLRNRSLYIIQFIRFPFVFSAFWVMLKNICLLQGHKDDDLYFVL